VPRELPIGDDRPFPRLRTALRGGALHSAYRYVRSAIAVRSELQLFSSVRMYCLFLGHARSGHSILGALLDAHPQIALSDELDALRYVAAGFSRNQLLWLSVQVARDQADRQRRKRGRGGRVYSYEVAGQWQGRERNLRVVGDSNAGGTVRALSRDPALLDRLRAVMDGLELRFVHVARNPYDNIATMMLRSGRSFESAFTRYFENWELIERLVDRIGPDSILRVRHEQLVDEPPRTLRTVTGFLGVEPSPEYLEACSSVLYASPSRTRQAIDWSDDQRARIDASIAATNGLQGYSFET
jgi:hypothetical protein